MSPLSKKTPTEGLGQAVWKLWMDGLISTYILNWHFFVLDLVIGILFHFMRKLKDIEQHNIGET